jgi:hypothetical protein
MYKSDFSNILEITNIINNNNVYMIIGFGSYHQFKSKIIINKIINNISKDIPKKSYLLYFGDPVETNQLDIGNVFDLLMVKRPDLKVIMIQIDKYKNKKLPKFVFKKYYHNDYSKTNKMLTYGGINEKTGKPVSNTKQWVNIHKMLLNKNFNGITKVFFLGGGGLSKKEIILCLENNIPLKYYYVMRKYNGDKKTLVKNTDNMETKFGPTITLINKIRKYNLGEIINYYDNTNIKSKKNIITKKTKTKKQVGNGNIKPDEKWAYLYNTIENQIINDKSNLNNYGLVYLLTEIKSDISRLDNLISSKKDYL